jgi:hypothetical protein
VEYLTLGHRAHSWSTEEHNEVDRTEWRKLLRSFSNVKTLVVARGLVKELTCCLRLDDGELPLELLPELQKLTYYGSKGVFTSFIDTRQNAGRSVTLDHLGPISAPGIANAFYSPYTGTPFIPPPMASPGSYYMPTVQLPDNASHHLSNPPPTHPPGPQRFPPGISADWIGPPTGKQLPFNVPWGLSPWSAAMSTPFAAFGAFAPAAPGHFAPPLGPHLSHGFAGPYTTPAQQYATPYGYQMAYQTPAWLPAPMAIAPPGPPPPAAPSRQPKRLTRAEHYDKIGHFAPGPHCR